MQNAQNSETGSIATKRPSRPRVTERGLALIMVVVILTTLLVLGTLFLQTAHLELTAAAHFRSMNESEMVANSGFVRATAELMYDVWGANEVRPFVADRWSYFGPDRSRDRFNTPVSRDIYTPMKLGEPFNLQGSGDGRGGFYMDDGDIHYAYARNGAPIDQKRSLTARREKELYFQRPKRTLNSNTSSLKDNVTTRGLTDWDAWHIADGYNWEEALKAGSPDATEGFGSDDIWASGPNRWNDAFLPRATDVNDCWEYGLMVNRIFKPSDGITVGMNRDYAIDGNNAYSNPTSQKWPGGLEYTIGTEVERSTTDSPWMYVDSHRICSDGFFRVFRYELIDETLKALDAQGNAVRGAYHLGGKDWGLAGKSGPAVNINQVNNNYNYEFWNDHGKVNPWTTPIDNEAVRPQMYHYNEAKWIYVYDDAGNPQGRYAVTIHPDGGMINVNSFADPKRLGAFDINASIFGQLQNLFYQADNGSTVAGFNINQKANDSTHGNSENLGVNFFRVGWLNDVLHPQTKMPVNVFWQGYLNNTKPRLSDFSATTHGTDLMESSIAMQFHVCAYKYLYGSFGSRAELALYFRKYGFLYQEDLNENGTNHNASLDQNGDRKVSGSDIAITRLMNAYDREIVDSGDETDEQIVNNDAMRLASIFGPHAYCYTFDRFWDADRIIVDNSAAPPYAGSMGFNDCPPMRGQVPTDPRQGYYDPRGIASFNIDSSDDSYGASQGQKFYNFKINSASAGLIKLSRMLSNTRYRIGADAGQWSPLSPHCGASDNRKSWRQASKAQAMLLAGMMNKASGFRITGNGLDGNYNYFTPYVSYGVRVDFFNSPTLGTQNRLLDPLVELYPNPSRQMLVTDVEGGTNEWGGERFTKGFSDIRIVNPGMMYITEVGRAPVLGDPRNCAIGSGGGDNWYLRLPTGTSYVMNESAQWKTAFPNVSTYINDNYDRTGFYHLYTLAHEQYFYGGAGNNFDMEKKPPIMNYIELLANRSGGNNFFHLTALAVSRENIFTRVGVSAGGLKTGSAPDGTYMWTRGLFYAGQIGRGGVNANTWYVIEADLFNPWCDRNGSGAANWPNFDDSSRSGAFSAWELTSVTPQEINIWDLSTGLTKINDAATLLTLKRRLFGWRGDLVFVRGYYDRRTELAGASKDRRTTYSRPDIPARLLCARSTSGDDRFGRMVVFTCSWDGSSQLTNFNTWPSNIGYDNVRRRVGHASQPDWYDSGRGDLRYDTVRSCEYFNFLDGWWDPSNSSGKNNGKFCMGYTYGYHHVTSSYVFDGSTNEYRDGFGRFWQWIGAYPHQYMTVWYHPYYFPMLIVYGSAIYGNGGMGTPDNPLDRVFDFCMLPNYLRSAEPLANAGGHFINHAESGVTWWDFGTGIGVSGSDYAGFYDKADFWLGAPSYRADAGTGCTWSWPIPGIKYASNPYTDVKATTAEFIAVDMPSTDSASGLAARDGLSATGNYGRRDTENYIQFLQQPGGALRTGMNAGPGGHFFSCSAVSFFDNDDPGMWVYAWTGDNNSFSWRQQNLVQPGILPAVNEVKYEVIHTAGTATAVKDDRLVLSKSIFVNGQNIGKKIVSHIYPTPGCRNSVWMYDALFWCTSDQGNPDGTADAHEWPWYEHNDGGAVKKEYVGMYDWDGNNRWNSWYACLLGSYQTLRQIKNPPGEDPGVATNGGEFWVSRKLDFMSLPIGYLDVTAIDPHLMSYGEFGIQCGANELFELGHSHMTRQRYYISFWDENITATRKTDATFGVQTYRDYADNDLDGASDIATDRPFSVDNNGKNLFEWWRESNDETRWVNRTQTDINHPNLSVGLTSDSNGYYNSDRKVAKKMFVNLVFYPFVMTYLYSDPGYQAANSIIGKKPLLGFEDERQFLFYWNGMYSNYYVPFYLRINDKNRFWNLAFPVYSFYGGEHYHFHQSGLFTEFGVSPVYTVLVTGQTITPDGKPLAQSNIEATVERTWDGKMNVLEYRLVPGMMDD